MTYWLVACNPQRTVILLCSSLWDIFFFFQAEDGIRDHCVTGVQTCALPICNLATKAGDDPVHQIAHLVVMAHIGTDEFDLRSEERRVGKECRSRWSPYH